LPTVPPRRPPPPTLLPYTTLFRSVAFPAGQEQPHGIAVSRHDPLAILVERDHGVIHGFGERHAAAYVRRIPAFDHDPLCLRVDTARKSTRLNSSHVATSYAVFCLA